MFSKIFGYACIILGLFLLVGGVSLFVLIDEFKWEEMVDGVLLGLTFFVMAGQHFTRLYLFNRLFELGWVSVIAFGVASGLDVYNIWVTAILAVVGACMLYSSIFSRWKGIARGPWD